MRRSRKPPLPLPPGRPLPPPSPGPIAIGPYVQHLTDETARICWATVSAEARVTDGEGKKEVRQAYDHHEIILGNLRPNTTYTYDVLGSADPAGTGQFTTLPDEPRPYTFIAYGDTRSQHQVHQRLVNRVIAEAPRFVLVSGDLVGDGMQIGEWKRFFDIEKELMRNVCLWPVLGNHESDSPYYFDFFSLPGNERYYMFSAGDVLFVILDDQGPDYPVPAYMEDADRDIWWSAEGPNRAYMKTQKAWFEQILSLNERAGYIIVVFHEPLISVKRSRVEDARRRRAYWGDVWQGYRVSMILNGHDHHYHRAEVGGVQYVTSGGGGAGLYDADTPAPETVKLAKVHHYLRFEVDAESTSVTAVDLEGNPIDQFKLPNRRLPL